MITANKTDTIVDRVCQCDIFKDIVVIEEIIIAGNKLTKREIKFPYVICLNQECDLLSDHRDHSNKSVLTDSTLLHIAIAPMFVFDQFRTGKHWGKIFNARAIGSDEVKKIKQNEVSRYHYLNFPEQEKLPEMIIDFKHFFTINRGTLYTQISKRFFSIAPLYREKISQRFSFYFSRIGLPDK